MKTLSEIYEEHKYHDGIGDKGTAHSYIPVYEKILEPYRRCSTMIEFGSSYLSIGMWKEYFENSIVLGADIREQNVQDILTLDATNVEDLKVLYGKMFNVVIDDASHLVDDQLKTFRLMASNYLAPKFIYIIEDISSYENALKLYENIQGYRTEIIDLRSIKNRYDDILLVIQS